MSKPLTSRKKNVLKGFMGTPKEEAMRSLPRCLLPEFIFPSLKETKLPEKGINGPAQTFSK
jgi:hypothetical protein